MLELARVDICQCWRAEIDVGVTGSGALCAGTINNNIISLFPHFLSGQDKRRVGTTNRQLGKAHGIPRGRNGKCLGGLRKKVSPVAGTVRGHSSRGPGPWTPPLKPSLPALAHLESAILPTTRVLYCPPATHSDPNGPSLAQRDTSAVTFSPGEGRGKPYKSLRQWN